MVSLNRRTCNLKWFRLASSIFVLCQITKRFQEKVRIRSVGPSPLWRFKFKSTNFHSSITYSFRYCWLVLIPSVPLFFRILGWPATDINASRVWILNPKSHQSFLFFWGGRVEHKFSLDISERTGKKKARLGSRESSSSSSSDVKFN